MFKLLDIALGFEKEAFMTSPDKVLIHINGAWLTANEFRFPTKIK